MADLHPNILRGLEAGREATKEKWRKVKDKYNKSPSACAECGVALAYKKRRQTYCSRSCSAKSNNRVRTSCLPPCENCGSRISKGSGRFCSRGCHIDFVDKKRWKKVQETGDFSSVYSRKSRSSIKRLYKKFNLSACAICGISEWRGEKLVLIMDHINGDPYDDSLDNLRLVCPNCDSQLPTYKAKNKGNGRHARRKRYSRGKSF